jgi:2-keto-3-deoxy-L-rhamnonate aldolase RhmA
MYRKNRLLSLVEQKKIPLGLQVFSGSPALIEILGQTGYDFIMIDTEHSQVNVRVLEELIRTAELAGLIPYVRVTSLLSEVEIRLPLEAGAEGLFLPRVMSVEDIKRVADFAFIPPKGRRRICPSVRAANYSASGLDKYTEWNNAEIALIPIIETGEALEEVDAICAHPDVKMLYFAPGNLAVQLGLGMQGVRSPQLQAASRKVMDAAARHDVVMIGGPMAATPESCRKALESGTRIFCLGLDTLGFRLYCEQTVAAVKNADGKSAIVSGTSTNVQHSPGQFYRATLWTGPGVPIDNTTPVESADGGIQREPPPGGFLVRVLEFYPEPDREKLLARVKESHARFGQKHQPGEEDMARHPMMHRTDTMDIIFVFQGEMDLITDVDEIRCTPGDSTGCGFRRESAGVAIAV